MNDEMIPDDNNFYNNSFLFFFSKTVIGVGIEDEDRKHTWLEDAESASF